MQSNTRQLFCKTVCDSLIYVKKSIPQARMVFIVT
jgi:hypothetical protein